VKRRSILPHAKAGLGGCIALLSASLASAAPGSDFQLFLRSAIANRQQSIDFSSRYLHDFRREIGGFQNVVGLDYYTKFSGAERDWATAVLQIYGARLDGHPNPPGFFEGSDDWELWPRILNFNFHLIPDRSLSVRVGHFEMPYGLEVPINSNGTIRQLNHVPNLGTKVDWGITLNGTLEHFQYEVGLSRGSGVELNMGNDSYIFAGRIGTVSDRETFYGVNSLGISFFQSSIQTPLGTFTRRRRIGFDAQHYWGPYGAMAEISPGTDNNRFVLNSLLEVNATNRRENTLFYLQYRHSNADRPTGWVQSSAVGLGVRWAPDNHWALSGQTDRALRTSGGGPPSTLFQLQVRYRF